MVLIKVANRRRFLDESSIPIRRQLRSHTAKNTSSGRKGLDSQGLDISRLSSQATHDDTVGRHRGTTPAKESGSRLTSTFTNGFDTLQDGFSSSKDVDLGRPEDRRDSSHGSHMDVPLGDNSPTLDTIIDETMADAPQSPVSKNRASGSEGFEEDRIRSRVESRPGSPGIDPMKAIPMSSEDVAQLGAPVINGLNDENHKAATAHLPPQEVQEARLRHVEEKLAERHLEEQKETATRNLSIKLPQAQTGRISGEPMSSPGSTVEANSATTPALHEASTDTSPENEGPRYDIDRSDEKRPDPGTPPELAPSKEEVFEKEEHDRRLKAQIDRARSEILASSPADADAQLRLEEEQAAASLQHRDREVPDSEKSVVDSSQDDSIPDSQASEPEANALTQSGAEVVQDIMDDEDDEVVGVPTPEDDKIAPPQTTAKPAPTISPLTMEDRMDVDSGLIDNAVKSSGSHEATALPRATDTIQETSNADDNVPMGLKDTPPISTPHRTPSIVAPAPPTLERMTTRVSSGAMRHKSVSEILGEIPRPNSVSTSDRAVVGKTPVDSDSATESNSHSRSSTPQSPSSRMRTIIERAKEKERSKLSTVVFAKQAADRTPKQSALVANGSRSRDQEAAEYFMPLILAQAYNSTRGVQSLDQLLMSAHKTITTSNAYVTFHDHQSQKILRRIHNLQGQDKWSFRQPKRSPEPIRPTAHWDELLKEAKWMRTDFREERKWKMAVARNLAMACAEWVEADEEDRKLLQVKASIPSSEPTGAISDDNISNDSLPSAMEVSHPTPELVASGGHDSPIDEFDEEPRLSLLDAVAPTAMFSLSDDDVVFGLRRSPITDRLLEELPIYGTPLKVPQSDLPTSEVDPDASWRRPALPLSKYIEGKIVLKDDGPPRKKSRYEYDQEDDEDDEVVFGEPKTKPVQLEPTLSDVALFNPENKHIRDRIHAGHQFRPPSENPMPLQSFFECRSSSQWTYAEDDELKALVREYCYNWQLISSILSSRSLFSSSAERRTPWECFERWIHLEGLPADMQKTHYFRAYNNRLEAAQRTLLAQAAQPPPQANAAGAAITPVRRRTTTSVRVERRRNQKHLTLVDAMRKLAKKRETSLQKQQHAASLAAIRKPNEGAMPQGVPRHTPQEFSRLKHDREIAIQEKMQRYQLQQEAARRVKLPIIL